MTPSLPTLELQYRRRANELPSVEVQLGELFLFSKAIQGYSPLLSEWFLTSDKSVNDALLYPAFDPNGPTSAALAVISTKTKKAKDIRSISVWNGAENDEDGAVLSSRCNILGRPDAVKLGLRLQPEVTAWKTAAQWVQAAASIWPAQFASFGPLWYNEKKVFKDRPGVGWLLYLPLTITAQQLPDARMLVPVMGNNKARLGTIIVSVIDGPFSLDNPDHVRVANDIEIRLVDQDLLPRFAEL
ncbi:MAG: immunity 52 family protein [Gammaproteobacteria bacterium]